MAEIKRMRGARPTPRHRLAAAFPHRIVGVTPPQTIVVPSILSYWLNQTDGDCVTAEEAFNKACSGILIADATVQTWATKNGVLNGADLDQVLTLMRAAGFNQDGNTYDDGPATSVDYTNAAVLQNAIAQGPVKIGVAADQLQNVVGTTNGWLATKFTQTKESQEDHCVSLCGYGTIAWLLEQLGATVPAGVDGTQPAYALFTWDTIGVIDVPSMLAITWEAWLRNPNTVISGTNPPAPDPLAVGPAPAPSPAPAPVPPAPEPTPIPPAPPAVKYQLIDQKGLPIGSHEAIIGTHGVFPITVTCTDPTVTKAPSGTWNLGQVEP